MRDLAVLFLQLLATVGRSSTPRCWREKLRSWKKEAPSCRPLM